LFGPNTMRLSNYVQHKNSPDLWAIEFSQTQGAFHVQPLSDSALTNLGLFLQAKPSDYALLGVARTRDEADAICDALIEREDRRKPFTLEERRKVIEKLMSQGVIEPALATTGGPRSNQPRTTLPVGEGLERN